MAVDGENVPAPDVKSNVASTLEEHGSGNLRLPPSSVGGYGLAHTPAVAARPEPANVRRDNDMVLSASPERLRAGSTSLDELKALLDTVSVAMPVADPVPSVPSTLPGDSSRREVLPVVAPGGVVASGSTSVAAEGGVGMTNSTLAWLRGGPSPAGIAFPSLPVATANSAGATVPVSVSMPADAGALALEASAIAADGGTDIMAPVLAGGSLSAIAPESKPVVTDGGAPVVLSLPLGPASGGVSAAVPELTPTVTDSSAPVMAPVLPLVPSGGSVGAVVPESTPAVADGSAPVMAPALPSAPASSGVGAAVLGSTPAVADSSRPVLAPVLPLAPSDSSVGTAVTELASPVTDRSASVVVSALPPPPVGGSVGTIVSEPAPAVADAGFVAVLPAPTGAGLPVDIKPEAQAEVPAAVGFLAAETGIAQEQSGPVSSRPQRLADRIRFSQAMALETEPETSGGTAAAAEVPVPALPSYAVSDARPLDIDPTRARTLPVRAPTPPRTAAARSPALPPARSEIHVPLPAAEEPPPRPRPPAVAMLVPKPSSGQAVAVRTSHPIAPRVAPVLWVGAYVNRETAFGFLTGLSIAVLLGILLLSIAP